MCHLPLPTALSLTLSLSALCAVCCSNQIEELFCAAVWMWSSFCRRPEPCQTETATGHTLNASGGFCLQQRDDLCMKWLISSFTVRFLLLYLSISVFPETPVYLLKKEMCGSPINNGKILTSTVWKYYYRKCLTAVWIWKRMEREKCVCWEYTSCFPQTSLSVIDSVFLEDQND